MPGRGFRASWAQEVGSKSMQRRILKTVCLAFCLLQCGAVGTSLRGDDDLRAPARKVPAAGKEKQPQVSAEAAARLEADFTHSVWPILEKGEKKSCLSCHTDEGMTPLLLFEDAP